MMSTGYGVLLGSWQFGRKPILLDLVLGSQEDGCMSNTHTRWAGSFLDGWRLANEGIVSMTIILLITVDTRTYRVER